MVGALARGLFIMSALQGHIQTKSYTLVWTGVGVGVGGLRFEEDISTVMSS